MSLWRSSSLNDRVLCFPVTFRKKRKIIFHFLSWLVPILCYCSFWGSFVLRSFITPFFHIILEAVQFLFLSKLPFPFLVFQELPTDEVLRQLKYIEKVRHFNLLYCIDPYLVRTQDFCGL